ncbi:hypothetical protein FDP41_007215 [Naegleria fowleri]|uniref:Uncharacterized protein n=1 Tax=Naegleria fowleri TaxID=5763 RepID=A0A6A5BIE2_NAEFO|nr:uncharacterized protein FDP41_007215 [Naegleria fowleri]KAF0973828.1 hypothetical protein FDP41_007215 [Naegleria fowleri]
MLCQPKRFKEKRKQEIASDYTVKVNDDESILQQLYYREEDTTVFENHSCSDQCLTVPKDYQHYTISTLNRVVPEGSNLNQYLEDETARTEGMLIPVAKAKRVEPAHALARRRKQRNK